MTRIAASALIAAACTGPTPSPSQPASAAGATLSSPSASLAPTPAASPSPTPSIGPLVEHRIAVRVVGGAGELFDRATGERFTPRGNNLIRLSGGHSTLTVGLYDPARADEALARMAQDGYNVVRIFLDTRIGGLAGVATPLDGAFLDNATDLLRRARAHGIYVLFTQDCLAASYQCSQSG